MLEKIKVSMLARKLQKEYDSMIYHKDEFDLNGFPLPFDETDKPLLTVLNGCIAWIYKEKQWNIYMALVPLNVHSENFLGVAEVSDDVFETPIGGDTFNIIGKESNGSECKARDIRKLILKNKEYYIEEIKGWSKRPVKE